MCHHLLGKSRGPCTPIHTHNYHSNNVLSVSARKLAAALWEFNHSFLLFQMHHHRSANNASAAAASGAGADPRLRRHHHYILHKDRAPVISNFLADASPSSPDQGLEDLRNSLLYTTLLLDATIASAKEEITRRECELIHVNDLLSRKQQLEQHQFVQTHQRDTISQSEEEQQEGFSEKHSASSGCEGNNNMPSPGGSSTPHQTTPLQVVMELAEKKPLPKKGKLLKAVVEAGPLLQTLFLAGPVPQWQHPPPQLNSIEIPPVAISPQQDSSSTKSASFPFNKKKKDLLVLSRSRKVIQHMPTTPTTTIAAASHHSLPHPSFS
ncbi:hypothetical protein JHK86_006519 [Glycine max]|nr:hypothetical protein JHK86_006519 [Glycine max]